MELNQWRVRAGRGALGVALDEVIDFLFQIEMADSVEQQAAGAPFPMELAQRGGASALLSNRIGSTAGRRFDLRVPGPGV